MPNDLHIRAAMRSQFQLARDRRSNTVPDKPNDAEAAPSTAEIEDLRAYLRGLSNQELREFGTSARRKCAQAEPGDPVGVWFAIELESALAEFRRRHPKKRNASADRKKIVRAGLEELRAEILRHSDTE